MSRQSPMLRSISADDKNVPSYPTAADMSGSSNLPEEDGRKHVCSKETEQDCRVEPIFAGFLRWEIPSHPDVDEEEEHSDCPYPRGQPRAEELKHPFHAILLRHYLLHTGYPGHALQMCLKRVVHEATVLHANTSHTLYYPVVL